MALIARGSGRSVTIQFKEVDQNQTSATKIRKEVRKEIKYYLVELGEPDPWAYSIYHCGTMANVYSKVHWSYIPNPADPD